MRSYVVLFQRAYCCSPKARLWTLAVSTLLSLCPRGWRQSTVTPWRGCRSHPSTPTTPFTPLLLPPLLPPLPRSIPCIQWSSSIITWRRWTIRLRHFRKVASGRRKMEASLTWGWKRGSTWPVWECDFTDYWSSSVEDNTRQLGIRILNLTDCYCQSFLLCGWTALLASILSWRARNYWTYDQFPIHYFQVVCKRPLWRRTKFAPRRLKH